MDFNQQIEEVLLERSGVVYEGVVMDSTLERNFCNSNLQDSMSNDRMNSSLNSTLTDTTPSDSGVQLDSEVSDVMIESFTSQNGSGLDNEDVRNVGNGGNGGNGGKLNEKVEVHLVKPVEETVVIDSNSNVTMKDEGKKDGMNVEEAMTVSTCSTFESNVTENIVFRRKTRKVSNNGSAKAPKKRVSFHEDILKSKRTDNIHIEHGFITYKNGRKIGGGSMLNGAGGGGGVAGRYSWCAEGKNDSNEPTELCANDDDDEEDGGDGRDGGNGNKGNRRRRVVYRNACSDVLDYGNSDIYDQMEENLGGGASGMAGAKGRYDNSGVFEYMPKEGQAQGQVQVDRVGNLYKCSCSSSNSSLESEETDKNSNRQSYHQAKSNSCDCIGMSSANNNLIGENCYYSEPSIENAKEKKSVWNKEKKPKSSCLKKTAHSTNIIFEQDLNKKVKKFNVHDMNQLLDNSSKMLFGSLKSIFTLPLPERGVPEGSEDLQAVAECLPELEQTPEHKVKPLQKENFPGPPESPVLKAKPFLSKSLDGSKKQSGVKKFVHNVDEQLRRKKEEELYLPTRENSNETPSPSASTPPLGVEKKLSNLQQPEMVSTKLPLQRQDEFDNVDVLEANLVNTPCSGISSSSTSTKHFRNKFIVNCESTVFEHTGISFETHSNFFSNDQQQTAEQQKGKLGNVPSFFDRNTPVAQAESDSLTSSFITKPFTKSITSFFKSFKDSNSASSSSSSASASKRNKEELAAKKEAERLENQRKEQELTNQYFAQKIQKPLNSNETNGNFSTKPSMSTTNSSSTLSDVTMSTSSNPPPKLYSPSKVNELRAAELRSTRHLPSPLKKKLSGSNLQAPARYGLPSNDKFSTVSSISDLGMNTSISSGYVMGRGGSGRDSKSTILSEDFDDILTITTTDTDKPESDIVILDYPDINDRQASSDFSNLLKPPQPPAAKTSLINRFLRNVTQKKILETSIRKNNFFAAKLNKEQRSSTVNLYVPGVKPKDFNLIEDLNAEIAMEIEMSRNNSPRKELLPLSSDNEAKDVSQYEMGVGEISIQVFRNKSLPFLRETSEQLYKVFKLYVGYSCEGYMTPVLVFLSNRALYITDLVRNKLCTKYVLAYEDLDVILMGPFGNTVLLSNSSRDMQQVLLAGGSYPAAALVSNLELCARRNGSTLPAVGHLTLDHLAPLQTFVRAHSCVGKKDSWLYYAVVNVPAGPLNSHCSNESGDEEPLGPHIKGFLMHRRVRLNASTNQLNKTCWNPGYFLLKAGVLYMFNDSCEKLPSWAMALAECQGARRTLKTGRPHCFEILLKDKILQLAAPDEYVASEWLQALLQSASGLFEMQDKHKTLGCTLVVTENHVVTLREDFSKPLQQVNKTTKSFKLNLSLLDQRNDSELTNLKETGSLLSSGISTPQHSSLNSTPTKVSQVSRSSATTAPSMSLTSSLNPNKAKKALEDHLKENYSDMCSAYGQNSGLEILTCADIKQMTGIKVPSQTESWWCMLEFSCQEALLYCTDDLVLFFASCAEMQRFLRLLEQLWHNKNNDLFPLMVLDEEDPLAEQCSKLYMDINRSWEPLLTAALGYPL